MGRSTCIRPLAPNAEPCRKRGKANLQHVCLSQVHGLASACVELLSHARIIGVLEKSDFAHARARVRNPLTGFWEKGGICAVRGPRAQRGCPGTLILPTGSYPRERTARALSQQRMAGTSGRRCACKGFLSLVVCSRTCGRAYSLSGTRAPVTLHPDTLLPPSGYAG